MCFWYCIFLCTCISHKRMISEIRKAPEKSLQSKLMKSRNYLVNNHSIITYSKSSKYYNNSSTSNSNNSKDVRVVVVIRKWQPTPVFLPGEPHGQRLAGYSPWGRKCKTQLSDHPWNSPGKNTGVGSLSLLQGIFPTQRSNPGLPHGKRILYQLSHKRKP